MNGQTSVTVEPELYDAQTGWPEWVKELWDDEEARSLELED